MLPEEDDDLSMYHFLNHRALSFEVQQEKYFTLFNYTYLYRTKAISEVQVQ